MRPIKARQHSNDSDPRLDYELRACLMWMIEMLLCCPTREMSTSWAKQKPLLMYTDGSSDPNRVPRHVVSAVLFIPAKNEILYTYCEVPHEVASQWLEAKAYIYLVELFAGPVGFDTFASEMTGQHVIHWVDNNAALGALVKGYSNKSDAIRLVADYWLRAAKYKILPYIDRVESESNISDDPSRLNKDGVMDKIGAKYREPNLVSMKALNRAGSPEDWFGGTSNMQRYKDDLRFSLLPFNFADYAGVGTT